MIPKIFTVLFIALSIAPTQSEGTDLTKAQNVLFGSGTFYSEYKRRESLKI